jgi:transcriptional regulator with XRE-family HTH domain
MHGTTEVYTVRMSVTADLVAGEVRAWLGRRNMSARQAALKIGWTQPYLSRRITGDVPFNVRDLDSLAGLLDVDPSVFFQPPVDRIRKPISSGFRSVLGFLTRHSCK